MIIVQNSIVGWEMEDLVIMPNDLKKYKVTPTTFEKLKKWGWVDGTGRSLEWKQWVPRRSFFESY